MKLQLDLHILPSEIRKKSCINCMNSKIQIHLSKSGDEYVNALCMISQDVISDNYSTQAEHCKAFDPTHWEVIKTYNYRKLQ